MWDAFAVFALTKVTSCVISSALIRAPGSAGRFMARVRSELIKAIEEERISSRINRQALAEKLGCSRSEINKQLSGEAPLSLRVIAELAWALDREASFAFRKCEQRLGQNSNDETTTVEWTRPRLVMGCQPQTNEPVS
ncbi:MAG: helix-turn-helix transcriptional regulator [Methylovirgula sp.]